MGSRARSRVDAGDEPLALNFSIIHLHDAIVAVLAPLDLHRRRDGNHVHPLCYCFEITGAEWPSLVGWRADNGYINPTLCRPTLVQGKFVLPSESDG